MSITEYKKLETALKESKAPFRVLFESAPIAIAILNTEGQVVQTNPASREMFRNVKVNPWQSGFSEVTCLDYLEGNVGLFQQLLQGKSDHCRIEKCFKQTDGNYAWYLIVLSVLRGSNGEVQYIVGMIEDITERKRAEEAKQESEEHFRTLFESAAIGIVGLDAQGHIISTNQVFRDMLGYRNSDFHGFSITDNTHPGDVDESRQLWNKLCEGQCDHYCIEQRYYKRDRQLIWVRMALSAIRDVQGKFRYAVGMVEDITERKREEEQSNKRIATLQTEVRRLRHQVGIHYQFDNIIGRSDTMEQIFKLMQKAIDSDLAVLLTGETGTGKELVAKAIHYNSPRKNKPFLDLNCGAVPHELVASTLFGHRKGAFTGAHQDNPGLFVSADGGTVFLDEIGEMPLEAQIHLLRVLEEGTVQCVGEPRSRSVDVRLIASTNQSLLEEVKAGDFREDLYYRLNVFPIHLPSLRGRRDDVPLLVEHFLAEACQRLDKSVRGFAEGVMKYLQECNWPGNVRELKNEVYRATALAEDGAFIEIHHFSSKVTNADSLAREVLKEATDLHLDLDYINATNLFRRRFIEAALAKCDGNRTQTAKLLGMHRPNLVALIKRLGIDDQT